MRLETQAQHEIDAKLRSVLAELQDRLESCESVDEDADASLCRAIKEYLRVPFSLAGKGMPSDEPPCPEPD
jgi:hypothetical protein